MPPDPVNKIEQWLMRYAQERRQVGSSFELHPATRRLLLGEVARIFPKTAPDQAKTFSLWPGLAWSGGVIFMVAGMILLLQQQPWQSTRQAAATIRSFKQVETMRQPQSFAENKPISGPTGLVSDEAIDKALVAVGIGVTNNSQERLALKSEANRTALTTQPSSGGQAREEKSVMLGRELRTESLPEALKKGLAPVNSPTMQGGRGGGGGEDRDSTASSMAGRESGKLYSGPEGLASPSSPPRQVMPLAQKDSADMPAKPASPATAMAPATPTPMAVSSAIPESILVSASPAPVRLASSPQPPPGAIPSQGSPINPPVPAVAPAQPPDAPIAPTSGSVVGSYAATKPSVPMPTGVRVDKLSDSKAKLVQLKEASSKLETAAPKRSNEYIMWQTSTPGSSGIQPASASGFAETNSFQRYGLATSTPAPLRFTQVQPTARAYRGTTRSGEQNLENAELGAPSENAAASAMLSHFSWQQKGNQIVITDQDGSIYAGQFVAQTSPAPARQRLNPSPARPDTTRNQVTEPETRAYFAATDRNTPQIRTFQASGTNQILQQPVNITGTFTLADSSATLAVARRAGPTARQSPMQSKAKNDANATPSPDFCYQINATATIGGTNQIKIEALTSPAAER